MVPSDTIISGGAKGADSLAERFADEFEIDKKIIKPDWDKHGKKAGFLRNTQIVQQSDLVIAFWDGQSNGTRDSLKKARTLNKPYIVVLV